MPVPQRSVGHRLSVPWSVVPAEVVDALGEGRRPKVAITINGHTWRSRIVTKGGRYLVGISAANRAAASIVEGDHIELTLELDTEPRQVDEPADLTVVLDAAPTARAAFDRLPFVARRPRGARCHAHWGWRRCLSAGG
jgi:Domain of unknown function (DUF1905)